jgi:putative membrane protein
MKKLFLHIKDVFARTFPSLFSRVAIVALLTLPLIYSALYLWAFWDPYNKVEDIPVAFVNLDKGDTKDDEYKNLGKDLEDELRDDNSVKWSFVTKEEAIQGLNDKKYYSYIMIPEDFTHQILSVDGDNPQKAKLILKSREATSVITARITNRVGFEVSEKLGHKITEEYIDNIFIDSRESADDIKKAVDGTKDLKDGLVDAQKGSLDLKNGIEDASKGSNDLSDGLSDAYSGAQTFNKGIGIAYNGSVDLYNGMAQLEPGAKKIRDGIASAYAGVETTIEQIPTAVTGVKSLYANLGTAATNSGTITATLKTLANSTTNVAAGISALHSGVTSLQDGAAQTLTLSGAVDSYVTSMNGTSTQMATDLNTLISSRGLSTADPDVAALMSDITALQTEGGYAAGYSSTLNTKAIPGLQVGLNSLSDGITQLDGLSSMNTYLTSLYNGSNALTVGLQTIQAAVKTQLLDGLFTELSGGLSTLYDGLSQLKSGSATLYDGVTSATSGSYKLKVGLGKLSDGSDTLVSGLWTLYDGSKTLKDGLNDLDDGSEKLVSGLSTASSGSSELYTKLQDGYNKSIDKVDQIKTNKEKPVMADPVSFDEELVDPVKTYGTGFTPYFVPLSLWVGAMASFLVIPEITAAESKKRGFRWITRQVGQRYLILALVGTLQAVILCTVLIKGLGLQPNHLELFYGFTILLSLLCFAIFTFLCTTMGLAGDFIGIVVLMLQLTSSGGSYPRETLPQFFQNIGPYLPMTYAVSTYRDIISGGQINVNGTIYAFEIAIAIFIVLTVIFKWLFSLGASIIKDEVVLAGATVVEGEIISGGQQTEGRGKWIKPAPAPAKLNLALRAFVFRSKDALLTIRRWFRAAGLKICLALGIIKEVEVDEQETNTDDSELQRQDHQLSRVRLMSLKLNHDFKHITYRSADRIKETRLAARQRIKVKGSKLRSKFNRQPDVRKDSGDRKE